MFFDGLIGAIFSKIYDFLIHFFNKSKEFYFFIKTSLLLKKLLKENDMFFKYFLPKQICKQKLTATLYSFFN